MNIKYLSPKVSSYTKGPRTMIMHKNHSETLFRLNSLTGQVYESPHNLDHRTNTMRKSKMKTQKLPPISPHPEVTLKRCSSLLNETQYANSVYKCSFKSRKGYSNGVKKSENQDSFIIKSNLLGKKGLYLFAVCDGHGEFGHLVSSFIKSNLVSFLEKNLMNFSPSKAFKKAFRMIDTALEMAKIDTEFSGSTCVALLIYGDEILCANVGDSRAVIASFKNNMTFQALTCDHKPDNESEAVRILNAGGRICSMGLGVNRIWLPNEDVPGLCMTRSIGDTACKSIGVISKPEISKRKLSKNDHFIILASDGIWEFISNQEAVQIISESILANKSDYCCQALVKEAVKRWTENSKSIDDITVLIIFIQTKYE